MCERHAHGHGAAGGNRQGGGRHRARGAQDSQHRSIQHQTPLLALCSFIVLCLGKIFKLSE